MTDQTPKLCKCGLATRLVGDGCEVCNPALALEYAKETITDLRAEVERLKRQVEELEVFKALTLRHVAPVNYETVTTTGSIALPLREHARGEKP